ncbi:IS66 family transposase zinc-finger binding domain-containing protein [Acinetobacter sp. YH01008]|uniref:IS66 family transposase zinc-finger binding domain-containing protein n=1 Tax=unclassified Acinetobacter TaxID=196816 RepID=UPI0015D28FD8|nr:IS66 family transposase zinc-finger binding domain-containing protein [Acinetobacter pseudolwoffii]
MTKVSIKFNFWHTNDLGKFNCDCKLHRIGEDISKKLNFRPAQFYKERHVRGKSVCEEPMPAQVRSLKLATWRT